MSFLLIALISILILPAQAQTPETEAVIPADPYQAEDVVIGSSRIQLRTEATQKIDVETKTSGSRPSLEAALQNQPNIQVVPTPMRGSNISLNGMQGEHVAIYADGDPILGRVDGALDTRGVSLGNTDHISIYQGLNSLPYGSQNIGGVVQMDSAWDQPRLVRLRSAGGNYGRTVLDAKLSDQTRDQLSYGVTASNWRTQAISSARNSDTVLDASARVGGSGLVTKQALAYLAGKPIDVRMGASGDYEDAHGILDSQLTTADQSRIRAFSDVRRDHSVLHFSYGQFKRKYNWLSSDLFEEKAFRAGPMLEESWGGLTVLGGSVADIHETSSTRIPNQKINRTTLGSYLGARYALTEHWVVGAGTRWDTGPELWSPRAEIRHLFQLGRWDHTTTLDTGLGFREASSKEKYLDFRNSAVGYRIIGNPDLLTERAWTTTLRHVVNHKKLTVSGSVFHVRVKNAIGFVAAPSEEGASVQQYSNISHTQTFGAQAGAEYHLPENWNASLGYQWMSGRNLQTDSDLFLQPKHRISMGFSRGQLLGLSLSGGAAWTSSQGYFDLNRNGRVDSSELAAAYWMTNLEAGYGFKVSGVSDLVRLFGRMDNTLNLVHEETLPVEPRTFLMGALVEL